MEKKMICIVCPVGCHLKITDENREFEVTGNTCKRGIKYAISEIENPIRIVTTTVKLINSKENVVSVKTSAGVPKEKIMNVMREINKLKLNPPIKVGDILIKNILNFNVDILATKEINK